MHDDHPSRDGRILPHRPILHRQRLPITGGNAYRGPHETFSALFVTGQKRVWISSLKKPVFGAFRSVTLPWPQSILFGQEGFIILRRCGRGQLLQGVAIVPGHPLRWRLLEFLGVPLQLVQIVERVGAV